MSALEMYHHDIQEMKETLGILHQPLNSPCSTYEYDDSATNGDNTRPRITPIELQCEIIHSLKERIVKDLKKAKRTLSNNFHRNRRLSCFLECTFLVLQHFLISDKKQCSCLRGKLKIL